jgi:hypothetical protein
MRILIVLLLLFSGIQVNGQKLKSEHITNKFIRPPKSDQLIEKGYTWEVTEKTFNQQMRTIEQIFQSGKTNYGRGQFFSDRDGIGSIPGFKTPQSGLIFDENGVLTPCSVVKVEIGQIDIDQVKPSTNGRVVKNDPQSAIAHSYDVWVSVPLRFDMRYAVPSNAVDDVDSDQNLKGVNFLPLYHLDEVGADFTRRFQFPRDLKRLKGTPGYSTTAQLDVEFAKHKRAFLMEIKDRMIRSFLKRAKLEVESRYCFATRRLPIKLTWVKDKKSDVDDLEAHVATLTEIEPLLNANIEANNRMNWYSKEIRAYTSKVLDFHNNFLKRDDLSNLVRAAARNNRMWLLFLNSKFEEALLEITALKEQKETFKMALANDEVQQKDLKKDYKATIGAIGYFELDKAYEFITDYQIRYEYHKQTLGWE